MVLRPDVLAKAIDLVSENDTRPKLLMSPRGKPLTQAKVRELAAGDGYVCQVCRKSYVDLFGDELGMAPRHGMRHLPPHAPSNGGKAERFEKTSVPHPKTNPMNEAQTRFEHIDPALKAAGWGVVEGSRIRLEYPISPGRLEGHGKRGKPLTADYVLVYRNTKLAVVEAKAWDEELTEGVAQAKNYAGKLAIRFTYATNGQGIYGIDMETGAEGTVASYPTPDELWARTFAKANVWRDRFAAVPFEDKGGSHPGRYYQDVAVERVMQAIADNRPRILLTLATGTGKTFIAFQIAWKLFHSRWNLSR
eukprot:gene8222-11141_t